MMSKTGEMAQQLGTQTIFLEDPDSITNTPFAGRNCLCLQSWVIKHHLLTSMDTACMWHSYIIQVNTHTHNLLKLTLKVLFFDLKLILLIILSIYKYLSLILLKMTP